MLLAASRLWSSSTLVDLALLLAFALLLYVLDTLFKKALRCSKTSVPGPGGAPSLETTFIDLAVEGTPPLETTWGMGGVVLDDLFIFTGECEPPQSWQIEDVSLLMDKH